MGGDVNQIPISISRASLRNDPAEWMSIDELGR